MIDQTNFKQADVSIKPLLILTAILILFILLPIPLAYKLAQIGSYTFTVASLVFPFFYTTADIIAEIYGLAIARMLIKVAILLDIIFSILCVILIKMPSPATWPYQSDFIYVLGDSLKLSLVGAIAIFVSQYINIKYLIKWKILLKGRFFWLRSLGASVLGELIVSVITISLGFLGKAGYRQIAQIIILSFVIKIMINLISALPNTLIVAYLRRYHNLLQDNQDNPLGL